MEECLWFINEYDTRIACHYLCNNPGKRFDTITCDLNWLRGGMEPHCLLVNTSLFKVRQGFTNREAYPKLT